MRVYGCGGGREKECEGGLWWGRHVFFTHRKGLEEENESIEGTIYIGAYVRVHYMVLFFSIISLKEQRGDWPIVLCMHS